MCNSSGQPSTDVDQDQTQQENCQMKKIPIYLNEESMTKYSMRWSQLFMSNVEASRLIEFCLMRSTLERSFTRINAERLLLLSALKRSMLLKEIVRDGKRRTGALPKNGCLEISNLRMPLIYSSRVHREIERFYLVTFQYEDQLLSSEVLQANSHSYLEVEETFVFRDLSPDFIIDVSIYSMHVKRRPTSIWDSSMCLPFKYVKSLFTRTITYPPFWIDTREPSFKIHGKCELTLSKISSSPFTKLPKSRSKTPNLENHIRDERAC
ncbi:uncharacterized protein LOC123672941 [Harmonia axyridis]|uniref:uncharacterized protein LOC123672941 n=1 Tax=Harmonia axyridis TaxID=115357 RepID=UPI001E275A1B|nr:uncharacterized protein LOC123672941 [Harmonia axyridis]